MCEGIVYELAAETAAPPAHMPLEGFLTIVLTALAVMLAILAIGIAVLAIWGYKGMKEHIAETVSTRVEAAVRATIAEYPNAADMVNLFQSLKKKEEFFGSIQEALETPQDVTISEPEEHNDVANASNRGFNQVRNAGGVAGLEQIQSYPGEVKRDASTEANVGNPDDDAGAGHPESPDDPSR